jgi:hypothetical protein
LATSSIQLGTPLAEQVPGDMALLKNNPVASLSCIETEPNYDN